MFGISKKQRILQKIIAEKGGMRNEQERKPPGCAADGGKGSARDEQNQRIQFAAANPVQEVLKSLHTTLRGLDAEAVAVQPHQVRLK